MTDVVWTRHPEAADAIDDLIAQARAASTQLDAVGELVRHTSTELVHWLDHVHAPIAEESLAALGFVDGYRSVSGVWRHPGAQLPAVVPADRFELALRVDDVVAFRNALYENALIEGSALSGLRRVRNVFSDGSAVSAVERRSWGRGVDVEIFSAEQSERAIAAWRRWEERVRPNVYGDDALTYLDATTDIAKQMVELVGSDLAASYVLEIERRYWQRRNTAGALQHARQDRFGLGWGNNDHHTFRSSRPAFGPLVRLLNTLGFASRERFYAGDQAGWGAQVLEHPGSGGVLFADVDLAPDEVGMDFSEIALPMNKRFGTIGMWCALHGESILGAGLHHLEGQFAFDDLRDDLHDLGVEHMKPFSDFPHLRQAFTSAEKWPVPVARLDALRRDGHISDEKYADFLQNGAAGSHLENLQRRDGFKGFNQHSVSETMRVTDPRNL